GIRVSTHPDQFILLNAERPEIVARSIDELDAQAVILDLMKLDYSAKIQLHVGGVYGDKPAGLKRFITRVRDDVSPAVRARLVVENDERLYSLEDVRVIHEETGLPILLDFFHHSLYHHGESVREALTAAATSWKKQDGLPLTDFSTQKPDARLGSHAESLDHAAFRRLLTETAPIDFDVMLEIKDKEKSALAALSLAAGDPRLFDARGAI
ncbi:MAG TPA: UV DNA damage repair endonuclease UvsE, partial [Spirochaetia bacterium]|nr:UV DNA damage repair endonuclease UvsE [Spirochaetia bacterium]